MSASGKPHRGELQIPPGKPLGLMGILALWVVFVWAPAPLLGATTPAPHIVLISGEPEYFSSNSLPAFAKLLETNYHFRCTYLERTASNSIPGLAALEKADLAILFVRRMTLPEEQLA